MNHARALVWLCLVTLLFAAPLAVRADDKIDITGKWEGSGTNPDGNKYECKVEITKNGDTFDIKWVVAGQEEISGHGILQGDSFSASYGIGNGHGVVVYKVTKGKLDGKWSIGDGKIYTEVLTKK